MSLFCSIIIRYCTKSMSVQYIDAAINLILCKKISHLIQFPQLQRSNKRLTQWRRPGIGFICWEITSLLHFHFDRLFYQWDVVRIVFWEFWVPVGVLMATSRIFNFQQMAIRIKTTFTPTCSTELMAKWRRMESLRL